MKKIILLLNTLAMIIISVSMVFAAYGPNGVAYGSWWNYYNGRGDLNTYAYLDIDGNCYSPDGTIITNLPADCWSFYKEPGGANDYIRSDVLQGSSGYYAFDASGWCMNNGNPYTTFEEAFAQASGFTQITPSGSGPGGSLSGNYGNPMSSGGDSIVAGMELTNALSETSDHMDLFGMCFKKGVVNQKKITEWLSEANTGKFNNWLQTAKYNYRVSFQDLMDLFKGLSLDWKSPTTVVYDKDVIENMQKGIDKNAENTIVKGINTFFLIFGGIGILYAIALVFAWLADMFIRDANSDKKSALNVLTLDRYEAGDEKDEKEQKAAETQQASASPGTKGTGGAQKKKIVGFTGIIKIAVILVIISAIVMLPITRQILINLIGKLIGFISGLIAKIAGG